MAGWRSGVDCILTGDRGSLSLKATPADAVMGGLSMSELMGVLRSAGDSGRFKLCLIYDLVFTVAIGI